VVHRFDPFVSPESESPKNNNIENSLNVAEPRKSDSKIRFDKNEV